MLCIRTPSHLAVHIDRLLYIRNADVTAEEFAAFAPDATAGGVIVPAHWLYDYVGGRHQLLANRARTAVLTAEIEATLPTAAQRPSARPTAIDLQIFAYAHQDAQVSRDLSAGMAAPARPLDRLPSPGRICRGVNPLVRQ